MAQWKIRVTGEVRAWLRELAESDAATYRQVNAAVDELAESGPALGRPLVDLVNSNLHNLKELRPRSGQRTAIRILFAFDPWSQAVLLVAGNKAGAWIRWYRDAIPVAERLFDKWVSAERARREEEST